MADKNDAYYMKKALVEIEIIIWKQYQLAYKKAQRLNTNTSISLDIHIRSNLICYIIKVWMMF